MPNRFHLTPANATVTESDIYVIPSVGAINWTVNAPGPDLQAQAYFWTKPWQAAEREADEDLAAGRVLNFANTEDLLDWLHRDED